MRQRRVVGPVVAGGAAGQERVGQLVDGDGAARVVLRVGVGIVQGIAALAQVGAQPGQVFGGDLDLFAHPVAHAAQGAVADPTDRQQLAGVVYAHGLERGLGFERVAQLGHRGGGGGGDGDGLKTLRLGRVQGGRAVECGPPGAQHVFGVVEALEKIAPQGFAEESGQGLAHHGVEDLGCDAGLGLQQVGRGAAVAPDRRLADGHLVERDSGGKALGVQVPTALRAQGQKRV